GGDQPLMTRHAPGVPPGYGRRHACIRRSDATREASAVGARDPQPTTREGQVGPFEVAERPVRAKNPGNAGGAKRPQFKVNVRRGTTAKRLAMSLPPPFGSAEVGASETNEVSDRLNRKENENPPIFISEVASP